MADDRLAKTLAKWMTQRLMDGHMINLLIQLEDRTLWIHSIYYEQVSR